MHKQIDMKYDKLTCFNYNILSNALYEVKNNEI